LHWISFKNGRRYRGSNMLHRLFDKDKKINNIVDQIQKHFGFLFEHDFRVIDKLYDNANFGNWIVLLRSEKLFIRFVQDRGDLSISIGPHLSYHQLRDTDNLIDVDILIDYIKKKDFDISPRGISKSMMEQLQRLSSLLLVEYDEVIAFFDNERFMAEKETIRNLFREKFKSRYPNISKYKISK
jgi:hypothetical protein